MEFRLLLNESSLGSCEGLGDLHFLSVFNFIKDNIRGLFHTNFQVYKFCMMNYLESNQERLNLPNWSFELRM